MQVPAFAWINPTCPLRLWSGKTFPCKQEITMKCWSLRLQQPGYRIHAFSVQFHALATRTYMLRFFILTVGVLTCLMLNVFLSRVLSRAFSALVLCEYLSPFASFMWLVPHLSFPAHISNPSRSSLHNVSVELLLFAMLPKHHVSLAGWGSSPLLPAQGKTHLRSPRQSLGSFTTGHVFKTGRTWHSGDLCCIKSVLFWHF